MSEDKKPKIDLKARLGKKTVSSPSAGGSIPPPVGIPRPGGSIPAPPFGSAPGRGPKIDAGDPYSSIAAAEAPARTEPQAIKVEMSEEVVQAQKKNRGKVIMLALVTAVIGGVLGYALGGGSERRARQNQALEGAGRLAKEVDEATAQIEQLAEVLKSATAKLADNKFPEEEVSKLGGINIPFSGANLDKGIGLFKNDVAQMLIQFAGKSSQANDQKDKLQRVLTGSKSAITDFLEQQTSPKVRWGTYVVNGPGGPWAGMQLLPEPFAVKAEPKDGKPYAWPAEFKINAGGKETKLKRYEKGEAVASDPLMIPVDPTTQGGVCPVDVVVRLRSEVGKLDEALRGDKTPGQEEDGLIDLGNALREKLKEIGRPGA
jgi:hypothetical protein